MNQEKKAIKGYGKRALWCLAVLLGAALLWLAARDGMAALYWTICNALIDLWGVTQKNIARAPWFVRAMVEYGSEIASLLGGALLLALSAVVRRRLRGEEPAPEKLGWRGVVRAAGTGAAALAGIWLVFRLLGTMRLARGSRWNAALPLGASTLMLAARLVFFYEAAYPLVRRFAGPRGGSVIMLFGALLLTAWEDSTKGLWLLNTFLMAMLSLADYEKHGTAWGMIAFRLAFSLSAELVGFPGTAALLYETYWVNSAWLNGGAFGPMAALGTTILLAGPLLRRFRPIHKALSWSAHRRPACRATRK